MVDPYAPPAEAPAPAPPATAYETYGATAVHEPPRRTERPERPWRERERAEPRTEPARPGLFWTIAAAGVGLLLLARLVLYFAVADELPGDRSAPAFVAVLGVIALSAGLALAAVLQRGLATPWRIALLLGAGFFAIAGWDLDGAVAFL